MICFTGVSRASDVIIAEQQRGLVDGQAVADMHQLKADALEMKDALLRGDIKRIAATLNRSWQAKKRTAAGISTAGIEAMFDTALAAGALGGKVSGAGGGGFLMFVVPPARRVAVIQELRGAGGTAGGIHLTAEGAESWSA